MAISNAHRKRFKKLCGEMLKLMDEIRQDTPEAQIFVEAEAGFLLFDQYEISTDLIIEHGGWTAGIGCGAF
jgi:hypothetical protein